jgi:hypothetical protein
MGGQVSGSIQLTRHKPGAVTLASRLTPQKRAELLERIALTGNVTEAADFVGCSRQSVYDLRAKDPAFDAAFIEAQERVTDRLEQKVLHRAENGTKRGVYYKGDKVGVERDYHDILSIFMLKAKRPDVYREGPTTQIAIGLSVDRAAHLSDAELERVVAAQLQQTQAKEPSTFNVLQEPSTLFVESTEQHAAQRSAVQRSVTYGEKGPQAPRVGGGRAVTRAKGDPKEEHSRRPTRRGTKKRKR